MNLAKRRLFSQLAAANENQTQQQEIRINGNENPVGPGANALASILADMGEANRYPFNSQPDNLDLFDALATRFEVSNENIAIGTGSTEILRHAIRIYGGPKRHIVTANLTYGTPVTEAAKHNFPVRQIPLDGELRLDIGAMEGAAKNAGLLYVCNPNNPTGTIHTAKKIEALIRNVRSMAPDCLILIDEAYHDYVTDPKHRSMIARATQTPNLLVCRTFSKAYGIAGLRLGFGVGDVDTIAAIRRYQTPASANIMAIAAAVSSLRDPGHLQLEQQRNSSAKNFTESFFREAGFEMTNSEANFLFVNLRRPAKEFRDACGRMGVIVGRDFPPFEKTHCRISIGTMDEMRRSCEVFAQVLGVRPVVRGA